MGRALRTLGRWFGGLAGFGGLEHGYFELQQGSTAPPGLIFPSMGPPCVPEEVWYSCEPAMSVIPDMAVTGIAAMALGGVTLVWAVVFMGRRFGGPVLALLAGALLLFGGGIVPPILGVIGGLLTQSSPQGSVRAPALRRGLASLWPWSLVAFFAVLLGTVAVGLVSNELVETFGFVVLAAVPGLVLLSVASAWAHDSLDRVRA
jgi:hypothetical protein